ncbi:MAG: hypothetical protein RLZ75_2245, partial [Pseudomonadota bacterium]
MSYKRAILLILLLSALVTLAVFTVPGLQEKAGVVPPQTIYTS